MDALTATGQGRGQLWVQPGESGLLTRQGLPMARGACDMVHPSFLPTSFIPTNTPGALEALRTGLGRRDLCGLEGIFQPCPSPAGPRVRGLSGVLALHSPSAVTLGRSVPSLPVSASVKWGHR
jgi:hypothetical protein